MFVTKYKNGNILTETHFFRPNLLEFIKYLKEKNKNFHSFTIIPCSTGKEPYSLALFLELEGKDYIIKAYDINEDLLKIAETAVYHLDEYDKKGFEKFLYENGDSYKLWKILGEKSLINFIKEGYIDLQTLKSKKINFLKGDILKGEFEPADAILCYNLLYYFNEEDYKKALEALFEKTNKVLSIDRVSFGCIRKDVLKKYGIDCEKINEKKEQELKINGLYYVLSSKGYNVYFEKI